MKDTKEKKGYDNNHKFLYRDDIREIYVYIMIIKEFIHITDTRKKTGKDLLLSFDFL
jgi:hypothetical protein